jgi:hypothetical protein
MQLRYSHQPTPLEPIVKQQVHTERVTPAQLEQARVLKVVGISAKSTQYELLKLLKFQKPRERHTPNHIKHLVKKNGRRRAKLILQKRMGSSKVLTSITDIEI